MPTTESLIPCPDPGRANHLWRYSPWSRVHPTGDISQVPDCLSADVRIDSTLDYHNNAESAPIATELLEVGMDPASTLLAIMTPVTHRINIPKNTILQDPVRVSVSAAGKRSAGRLDIEVGSASHVRVEIDIDVGNGWLGWMLCANLGMNSGLELWTRVLGSPSGLLLRSEGMQVAENARATSASLVASRGKVKADLRASLDGPNASYDLGVAVDGSMKSHCDHHLRLVHGAPHTQGRLRLHAACADQSHNIGTGRLVIEKNCSGADGGQVYRSLILSDDAQSDSIPELEVLTDDVRASHGAASGPVDPEQIHYLMSRGLELEEAKREIIRGLFVTALDPCGLMPLPWRSELGIIEGL